MLLTVTYILRELEKALSPSIFNSFDYEFYEDILYNKSLYTYSIYYPDIRICTLKKKDAIPQVDSFTGKTNNCSLYRIPNLDPENTVYVGVGNIIHEMNDSTDYFAVGFGGIAEGLLHKTITSFNQTRTLFVPYFQAPDLVEIRPAPEHHTDFAIEVKCRTPLNRIHLALAPQFLELFICDVKIDIYNMNPNLRESMNLGGIEINAKIDEFQSAVDKKNEILEKWNSKWFLEPETYSEQFIFQKKLF